jgi:hypothetical protein
MSPIIIRQKSSGRGSCQIVRDHICDLARVGLENHKWDFSKGELVESSRDAAAIELESAD